MQDLLQEKDEEIARLSRAERKNHEELVESLRANIHAWYKEREEHVKQRYDGEKVELIKEIKLLVH